MIFLLYEGKNRAECQRRIAKHQNNWFSSQYCRLKYTKLFWTKIDAYAYTKILKHSENSFFFFEKKLCEREQKMKLVCNY